MRTPARRLGAVAVSTALSPDRPRGRPGSPRPAQAANNSYTPARQPTGSARQLTNGVVHNEQYDFDDYGLSLDVVLRAARRLGVGRAAAGSRRWQAPAADLSAPPVPAPSTLRGRHRQARHRGRAGRPRRHVVRRDEPRQPGSRACSTPLDAGEIGRGVDRAPTGTTPTPSASPGRASARWPAHSSLARRGRRLPAPAAVRRRASSGSGWRPARELHVHLRRCRRRQPRPASTPPRSRSRPSRRPRRGRAAWARRDAPRRRGWLVSEQAGNGSFYGQGTANSNSTGLAAGRSPPPGTRRPPTRAAAWVGRRQVTAGGATTTRRLARRPGRHRLRHRRLHAGRRGTASRSTSGTSGVGPRPGGCPRCRRRAARPCTLHARRRRPRATGRGGDHAVTVRAWARRGRGDRARHRRRRDGHDRSADRAGTRRRFAAAGAHRAATPCAPPAPTARRAPARHAQGARRRSRFGKTLAHRPLHRGGTSGSPSRGLAPHEFARLYYRGAPDLAGPAPARPGSSRAFDVGPVTRRQDRS